MLTLECSLMPAIRRGDSHSLSSSPRVHVPVRLSNVGATPMRFAHSAAHLCGVNALPSGARHTGGVELHVHLSFFHSRVPFSLPLVCRGVALGEACSSWYGTMAWESRG
jgi:hypothetical protein